MEDKYKKIKKRVFITLGIFAVIIIPFYTIIFALNDDIFNSSLSIIGNSLGKKAQLIIWCISLALFFFCFLGYLFKLTNMKNKRINRMLIATGFLLILTGFTPFLPEIYPILAEFHNYFAVGSVILTLITLYCYVFTLRDIDKPLYRKALFGIIIVTFLNALVFYLVGMCSAIEISFVVLVCGYLFIMLLGIYKSDKIDIDHNIKKTLEEREQRRKDKNIENKKD